MHLLDIHCVCIQNKNIISIKDIKRLIVGNKESSIYIDKSVKVYNLLIVF
jgi:hypothetical protein